MRAIVTLLLACACTQGTRPVAGGAVGADAPGLEVVVGSAGAVVIDRRRVDVPASGEVRFAGVPPALDLGAAQLRSLTDARGTRAVAQRLVPAGAEGETRATLAWQVRSQRPGPQLLAATYRTGGLEWQASYTVVIDDAAGRADVSAQVEVDNHAGASFDAARVLVVSGDAAQATATPVGTTAAPPPPARTPSPRMLELPGRVTLAAATIAAVPLFEPATRRVPARRTLVFDAVGLAGVWPGPDTKKDASFPVITTHDVRAFVEVHNDTASGLGLPLPAGTVRFFRRDRAGQLIWLEDEHVDDVAIGQHLRVPLGVDDELTGTRRQIAVDVDDERHHLVEEIEIVLENRGGLEREVTVVERLARSDHWRLTWWSAEPEKDDARSARFQVTVPARGATKFRYRVMYSW